MVNKCMQWFIILIALTLLGAIGLSFKFAKIRDIEPVRSRLTGYPTWHGKIEGFDPNRDDAMAFLGFTLMVLGGFIGLKAVRNPPKNPKYTTYFFTVSDDSDRDPTGVPAIGFNRLLVLYNWVTSTTVLAAIVFDVGKVFVVIGVLHNATEIVILTLLGSGGRIRNSTFYLWLLFYVLSVVTICDFVDFPGDAAFFKFQGLCMDFALVITYIRILIATKEHIRDAGRDTLPLNIDDTDIDNDDDNARKQSIICPTSIDHPNQLWLLIAASVIHLVGNVMNTFFTHKARPLLVFALSYAVTFPIYVIYAYLDTNTPSVLPQKRIYMPYTAPWKVILITIFSIICSALTLRTAVSL